MSKPKPHSETAFAPMIDVWCVKHRDGWCATRDGEPERGAFKVPTKCGNYVMLPWDFNMRLPTCAECYRQLEGQIKAEKGTRR